MWTTYALQKKELQKEPSPSSPDVENKSGEVFKVQAPEAGVPVFLQNNALSSQPPPVQRQFLDDEAEDEGVQAKLTVGNPDDEYERQANRFADTVMRLPEASGRDILDEGQESVEKDSDIQAKIFESETVEAKNKQSAIGSDDMSRPVENSDGGTPLPESTRLRIEPVLGTSLNHVAVHDTPSSRQAARSIQAKAFTHRNHIYLGEGQSAHDVSLMAHEAAHTVQQSYGMIQHLQRVDEDDVSGEGGANQAVNANPHPLSSYYLLLFILPAEEMDALEQAALRREAVRRGETYDGPLGITTTSSYPLADFLPDSASFESREAILGQYFSGLGTPHGPSGGAGIAAREIARNETLRHYLGHFENSLVEVELVDPDGLEDTPTRLRFFVDGMEVQDRAGEISVESLDDFAPEPLFVVADNQGLAVEQLVHIAVALEQGREALPEVRVLNNQIRSDPGQTSVNGARSLVNAINQFSSRVVQLRDGIYDENLDKLDAMTSLATESIEVRDLVADLPRWLRQWQGPSIPEETAGEFWMNEEASIERTMAANAEAGGIYYAAIGVNALEWASVQIYRLCGNFMTLGYMDREARNAMAYRRGEISNSAYAENIWWNMGASALTAVVIVLTAGWGGRLAGFLGADLTTGAGMMTAGTVEGVTIGMSTAVGADAYSAIIGATRDDPYVSGYHESAVMGPEGWIEAGLAGGLFGGVLTWGALRSAGPGPIAFVRPRSEGGIEVIPAELEAGAAADFVESTVGPRATAIPEYTGSRITAVPEYFGSSSTAIPEYAGPRSTAVPEGAGPRIRVVPEGVPEVSTILDPTGTPFGAAEYVAAGGMVYEPAIYGEVGGRIVRINPRTPPDVTLYGPHGQVVAGRGAGAVELELFGPRGEPVTGPRAPIDPSREIVVWGDAGWEAVPGNAPITGRSSGRTALQWQHYESQGEAHLRAGAGERQVSVGLPRPMRFSGRQDPQTSIEADVALADRSMYGEIKCRNWEHSRFGEVNAVDLAGSLERMYVASGIEARVIPAASSADFVVVSSRPVPAATTRIVMRTIGEWMQGNGYSTSAIYDFLSRIRFVHLRPSRP